MGGDKSTHSENHLCARWNDGDLVNTSRDIFCTLVGMEGVWSSHVEMNFFVVASMESIWSTHGEMHFVFSLTRDGFGPHMLGCTLCPRWHGVGLFNAC
jgi:hypothetical protein